MHINVAIVVFRDLYFYPARRGVVNKNKNSKFNFDLFSKIYIQVTDCIPHFL